MATRNITSAREAARISGISANAIERRIRLGTMPPGPWTSAQLRRLSKAENAGIRTAHGSPERYRAGCDCDACRLAHDEESKNLRRERSLARIGPYRDQIIEILSSGGAYADVEQETGLTPQAINGVARFDEEWRKRVDDALMAGRRSDLAHGTPGAWAHKCRCPECRRSHSGTLD